MHQYDNLIICNIHFIIIFVFFHLWMSAIYYAWEDSIEYWWWKHQIHRSLQCRPMSKCPQCSSHLVVPGGWPARGGGVQTGFTSSSFPSPLYLMLFSSVSPLPASRQDLWGKLVVLTVSNIDTFEKLPIRLSTKSQCSAMMFKQVDQLNLRIMILNFAQPT